MNKSLLVLCLIFSSTLVFGQFLSLSGDTLYGDEWIDYNQEYYKIPVAEDGIYRISFDELTSSGVPVGELKGENLQMYHNGDAYPFYVSNKSELQSGDFIEFYGRKNRGELDAIFYENAETMQLNPEYSLFTDTSAYFLSWNTSSNNVRVNEVVTDLSDNNLPIEKFYMHKERVVQSNRIHKPTRQGGDNVRYSHFDVGEGFGGNLAQVNEISIKASRISEEGGNPSVDIRYATNGTAHVINFSINGEKKATWNPSSYVLRQEHVDFTTDELKSTNKIRLEGTIDQFDRNVIAVVDLNYPREYNFDNEKYFEFYAEGGFFDKSVEIENFNGVSSAVIYDPATGMRIIPEVEDGKLKFIIPGADEGRNLIVYNTEDVIKSVMEIEKMNFINFGEMDHDYIVISHPKLMGGSNMVQEYADYRNSAAGGSFNSVVVNVEDLYEQFSYGVHRHSYSVKNFINYVKKNWSAPKNVFIIGKGREYALYRTKAQIEDPLNAEYTVPTFGYPGSDNILSSSGALSVKHLISSGRLAARSVNDLEAYFDKVKLHEDFENQPLTIEDRLWKKRILHLVGAKTELQESIGSYLNNMANTITNNKFGANVTTFTKSSTETIQEADADAILHNVDLGLSVLTFFGHSSVGTFDFNIDDVNKLNNYGKYPLVVSLGCYSGNVHTGSFGISEQYVVVPNRGAIGFIASSSTAYVAPQGNFGNEFYSKLGDQLFGKSLGDIFASTLDEFADNNGIHTKILTEQMTLHGDPAIKLHAAPGSDYVFDYASFKTDPNVVESNSDQFDLSFKVANLGQVTSDSIQIKLNHIKSNGEPGDEIILDILAPKYDTLITTTFQNGDNVNVGKNIIKGEVDVLNRVNELPNPGAEENNILRNAKGDEGFEFYSINNSAEPVSPCDFGIYAEQEVKLLASTYNAIASEASTYVIELDTTLNFDSGWKMREEISSKGGLIEWSPEADFKQSEVYYWRVSPDSLNEDVGYRWVNSSFVYLPNSSNGWNQSHYQQYNGNEFENMKLVGRELEFDTTGFFIKIFNSIYDFNTTGYQYDFSDFAASVRPWNFLSEGVAIVVSDTITGAAWTNSGGDFGSIKTSNFGSFRCFAYRTSTTEEREKVINFLENEIPDGNFVFFFSVIKNINADIKPEEWEADSLSLGTNIYKVLEKQGAVLARDLKDAGTVPYTFIYQKGKKALSEEIGEDISSSIVSTAFITLSRRAGQLTSTVIGPAKSWDKFVWSKNFDSEMDSVDIKIFGIDVSGEEKLLIETKFESEVSLTGIDAAEYPNLKINALFKDDVKLTPAKINFWRVFFEGFPDVNLKTGENFVFNRDTLQRGEDLVIQLEVENISEYGVDTMSFNIEITNERNESILFDEQIVPLGAGASTALNFTYNTKDLIGKYQVSINVNKDQEIAEKHYFNNFGLREFVVITDEINPILDVNFDGNKIIDGDIVSPTPIIQIDLKDENKFLLLNDPAIFSISLTDPNGNEEEILAGDPRLDFTPATNGENNEAKLELRPDLKIDGIYEIEVNARDMNNNFSGDLNYKRSFEVINEQMVSKVLNYPNPFSSSTEFIFTLTGREVPDDIKIQIMTVSGKTVKEIFKEELGPLKIGVNRTSYKYDGTDTYGNKLANGVYLYRVVAKHNNEALEQYEIGELNQYFKNNIGKLVILR
ncbi:putative type IX secretion system sortase PorU2 [Portibacter lacus]|uniref:Gingipain domain-containing protein n=1 Tax=Portibacter lacus TaxID=1099794 RepID=A0AA37SQX0_9BACT|nr:C25 family cysteine peptidase [Portibacter lacus]GLR19013.1 hypothetical protein GCM10007940_36290 [Portibacter lacus]